jgi:hypothetical protein
VITRDCVFDEGDQWDWSDLEKAEIAGDNSGGSTFTVEYPVVGNRGAGAEESEESAPSVQFEPETEGGANIEAEEPVTPVAAQSVPVPEPSPVQFVSPSSSISEDHLDATHGESPVRFRTLDNIIGVATPPGLATRHLDGGNYLQSVQMSLHLLMKH